jgi:chorismate mutase
MTVRGVRGAVQATGNNPEEIWLATSKLLEAILKANPNLEPGDIASAFFTVTEDLTATYPAYAARTIGWDQVPMLCAREVSVPGGMERVIRVLLHWNTPLPQTEIRHVYLGKTARLRPDLAGKPQTTD